jgi:hypothetical protein
MRVLLPIVTLTLLAGVAFAGDKELQAPEVGPSDFIPCTMNVVQYDWDFAVGDQGFTTTACDPTGGDPVWEWGTCNVPGAPGTVWGTVLNANYPNNAGEGLVSPSFLVGTSSYLVEVLHYVHIESNFDGGNMKVNGTVVAPLTGYPATISTSTSFYAFCVDMEDGFTGNGFSGPSEEWVTRCWDLTPYMTQSVELEFDFGTDSSVSYPGWFLAYVKVGGEGYTPVEPSTWGDIKSLYE